jgi:hypothetical protein
LSDYQLLKKLLHDVISVVKRKGRRPVGRPWGRWKDNIKIDFIKVG